MINETRDTINNLFMNISFEFCENCLGYSDTSNHSHSPQRSRIYMSWQRRCRGMRKYSWWNNHFLVSGPCTFHYDDVIMTAMASQITSLMIVYSTVYSGAYQRKHQSSASLAFVWGSHRDRWIPRTKGQLRGKCFHLMTSSCSWMIPYLFMH